MSEDDHRTADDARCDFYAGGTMSRCIYGRGHDRVETPHFSATYGTTCGWSRLGRGAGKPLRTCQAHPLHWEMECPHGNRTDTCDCAQRSHGKPAPATAEAFTYIRCPGCGWECHHPEVQGFRRGLRCMNASAPECNAELEYVGDAPAVADDGERLKIAALINDAIRGASQPGALFRAGIDILDGDPRPIDLHADSGRAYQVHVLPAGELERLQDDRTAERDQLKAEKAASISLLRQATNTKYPNAPQELLALTKVAADMLKTMHDALHEVDAFRRERDRLAALVGQIEAVVRFGGGADAIEPLIVASEKEHPGPRVNRCDSTCDACDGTGVVPFGPCICNGTGGCAAERAGLRDRLKDYEDAARISADTITMLRIERDRLAANLRFSEGDRATMGRQLNAIFTQRGQFVRLVERIKFESDRHRPSEAHGFFYESIEGIRALIAAAYPAILSVQPANDPKAGDGVRTA